MLSLVNDVIGVIEIEKTINFTIVELSNPWLTLGYYIVFGLN